MTKTEIAQSRVPKQLVKSTDAIFARLGMTRSQAIRLFLVAVENHGGMPFELKVNKEKENGIS